MGGLREERGKGEGGSEEKRGGRRLGGGVGRREGKDTSMTTTSAS